MYFLRAWNYFSKLKTFGDYPIVTETLPDDKQALIEASRRQPRHKVARFILEDLDRAIGFLSENPEGGTNRISRYVANLVKSRVALYEAAGRRIMPVLLWSPMVRGGLANRVTTMRRARFPFSCPNVKNRHKKWLTSSRWRKILMYGPTEPRK